MLLFSPDTAPLGTFAAQLNALNGARAALDERAHVVITVRGDSVTAAIGSLGGAMPSAAALRRHFRVPDDSYQFIMVGKDGGVKRRTGDFVPPLDLFCQVDAMPMRRQEMRAKGQQSAC